MDEETNPNQPKTTIGKSPSGKKMGRPRKWAKVPIDLTAPPTSVPVEQPSTPEAPDGGLDAALSGAGEALSPTPTPTPPQPPEGVSSSPGKLPAAKPVATQDECEALVNFADMVGTLTCRTYAMIKKVPFDTELQKLSMLSSTERKQLMILAPSAAPYVMELLKNAGVIGAVLFGVTYSFMLSSRFGPIKEKAKWYEAERKLKEEKEKSGK